ncbi:MAG: class I SAM-dependent methyltransferase [Candidatus Omnitrophota bacterium]
MKKPKKDKRDELLAMIPADARRILDIGCGDGGLGLKLKEGQREIVGVERSEQLCQRARQKLDRVITGDIEGIELPFPKGYFDCILYADVLEHLVNPLGLLEKHRDHLNDKGYIVASIPNICYYKVIKRLICNGTWDYMENGILDKTHLRFFTVVNIKELFSEAGYEIIKIKRNITASKLLKILNFIFFNSMQHFLTYQYYIVAKKASDTLTGTVKKRKIEQF